MDNTVIGLGILSIAILIVILLVDIFRIWRIEKNPNEKISFDKYYELKWRINLLTSIAVIASLSLGVMGYTFKENLIGQISELSGLTKDLQDSIGLYKGKVDNFKKELEDKEKRVTDMDNKIASVSKKNAVFQNDVKNNIGKIYKDLRNEDIKAIFVELERDPDKIEQHANVLNTVTLSEKYYPIVKKGFNKNLFYATSNKKYLCLIFKNYPHRLVKDIGLLNKVTEQLYSDLYPCLTDDEFMEFFTIFINYIYKNGGVSENKSEMNWIETTFAQARDKDSEKIATHIYNSLKTKYDRFYFFEIVRNRRIELQERKKLGNDKAKIDAKTWTYNRHQLPYMKLLLGNYGNENNSDYQNKLLDEIKEVIDFISKTKG